jgi:hypothetical protein
MLKKMLMQGLLGAALIGAAAALYSQAHAQGKPQDNGYLTAPAGTKASDRHDGRKMHDKHKDRLDLRHAGGRHDHDHD